MVSAVLFPTIRKQRLRLLAQSLFFFLCLSVCLDIDERCSGEPSAFLIGLSFSPLFVNTKNSLHWLAILLIIQIMLTVNGEM
jgi:hypothetical protein